MHLPFTKVKKCDKITVMYILLYIGISNKETTEYESHIDQNSLARYGQRRL